VVVGSGQAIQPFSASSFSAGRHGRIWHLVLTRKAASRLGSNLGHTGSIGRLVGTQGVDGIEIPSTRSASQTTSAPRGRVERCLCFMPRLAGAPPPPPLACPSSPSFFLLDASLRFLRHPASGEALELSQPALPRRSAFLSSQVKARTGCWAWRTWRAPELVKLAAISHEA